MRKRRQRTPAPTTTIVAAIVLLVQAFLGGTWMGTQAAAGPHDAFGNVFCITAHSGGASRGAPQDGGYDCDCCLSGCDVATAIIPLVSGIGAIPVVYLLVSDVKQPATTPVRRQELGPLIPRGPPTPDAAHLGEQPVRA